MPCGVMAAVPVQMQFVHDSACTYCSNHMIWFSSSLNSPDWALCSGDSLPGLIRIGEAKNPGPQHDNLCAISVLNPSGISSKESHILALPPGIVNIAETHLSAVNMQPILRKLTYLASQQNRRIRCLAGAPVPLRPQSQSVGTWSGVLQLADTGCHQVPLPWPSLEFQLGRAMVSRFVFPQMQVLGGIFYCWPLGPTWPNARIHTANLLQHLSCEIVFGASGPRFLGGDLNGSEENYPIIRSWLDQGWVEVQELFASRTGAPVLPTCKGRTRPDRLYISPELAAMFLSVEVRDNFADHSSIVATFGFPACHVPRMIWPMASKLPWDRIDLSSWHSSPDVSAPQIADYSDPSAFLQDFGKAYEKSLGSHCSEKCLPSACHGRAQAFEPIRQPVGFAGIRPSRQGEEGPASGLLCRQVAKWFKQLRRIQSLLHNVRRNSEHAACLEYRLLTWRAIRLASGFRVHFEDWWPIRPIQLQGSINVLPEALPSLQCLETLYLDFKTNYRHFESWNVSQRQKILKEVVKDSIGKAFKEALPRSVKPVDSFASVASASIVTVAPGSHEVVLDMELDCLSEASWTLDGEPANVRKLENGKYTVVSDLLLCPGQTLERKHFLTDAKEMLTAVRDFWVQRWSRHQNVPPSHWSRVLGFIRSQIAPLPFDFPRLTVDQWDNINRRYTPRAARGPDSFDHLDLRRMPPVFKDSLVDFMDFVETNAKWPQQLLAGLGHCLPKHSAAELVGEHRPIIVFSLIYRSWASWRCRGFLQTLGRAAGPRMRGFLPGREAGDLWFQGQALIEHAICTGEALLGCSADIEKAFENVPREPLAALASAMGLPSVFIKTWMQFLTDCRRRFSVLGEVGADTPSSSGLPEGCGLSVLGMVLIDFCWDRYQSVCCPDTLSSSYVDNFSLVSSSVIQLLRAYATMDNFMDIWQLKLDTRKTFFWATSATDRAALKQLGFDVKLKARELGGAMSFCKRSAASLVVQRIQSLEDNWRALRRSHSSTAVREFIIRQAFWPRGLHGICITPLHPRHIAGLRTRAVRALGFGSAGSCPMVRLTLLSSDPLTDPGCYQLIRTFMDFRRLLCKHVDLISLWVGWYHLGAAGSHGPFAKLHEQAALIGWHFTEPPLFTDHDGCTHDLLQIPSSLLRALLEEAWLQHLATEISKRKDFAGISGLQSLTVVGRRSQSAREMAQLNALREGAFLTRAHQGKFDLQKGTRCQSCGALDTYEHRCTTCPFSQGVRSAFPQVQRKWHRWAVAVRERALPQRNPHLGALKHALMHSEECETAFEMSVPPGHHDLFTDGSFERSAKCPIGLAAWVVVSATWGRLAISGALGGLQQSADRSELRAIVEAVRWSLRHEISATIWSDSAYAASGFHTLLQGGTVEDYDSNEDLWRCLQTLVIDAMPGQLQVQHVPGHAFIGRPLDFASWHGYWNERADIEANAAQAARPPSFVAIWQMFVSFQREHLADIELLQAFHLALAERYENHQQSENFEDHDYVDVPPVLNHIVDQDPVCDLLPVQWKATWKSSVHSQIFGVSFVLSFLDLVGSLEWAEGLAYEISWLEFVTVIYQAGLPHPRPGASNRGQIWVDHDDGVAVASSLTVAQRLRFLTCLVRCLNKLFDLQLNFMSNLDRTALGVSHPLSGLVLTLPESSLLSAQAYLRDFTSGRKIRTANDLSRPFRT